MRVNLSIIVPAYNAEKYLPECLDSILASTYQDYEILLIDDGSADETGNICDRYQQEHVQIKVFHTENRGLPSARNLGIENASGQFIGFVDADDQISPDMFHSLVSAMTADVQLSICAYHLCNRDALPNIIQEEAHSYVELDQKSTAAQILTGGARPYVWNKLYRHDILNLHHIRFRPDTQGAEDLFFNMDYLRYCHKAVYWENKQYFYIITAGSITNTFRENRTVSKQYVNLPRSWRFTAEVMDDISDKLALWSRSRAAMFYQTVLRKLERPSEEYIAEAVSYVAQHKNTLLHYKWGIKFYLSALMLCAGYPLWAKIFRRGID